MGGGFIREGCIERGVFTVKNVEVKVNSSEEKKQKQKQKKGRKQVAPA